MSRQRTMEKIMSSQYVSIGELSRLTGCRYSTLKHYTEEGMLPFEQEEQKLTRRYDRERTVRLILYICGLREKGYTIPKIKQLLTEENGQQEGRDSVFEYPAERIEKSEE